MNKRNDLTGKRFGRLVAIEDLGVQANHRRWNCVCDCGKVKAIRAGSLTSGSTKSCGCWRQEHSKMMATARPIHERPSAPPSDPYKHSYNYRQAGEVMEMLNKYWRVNSELR